MSGTLRVPIVPLYFRIPPSMDPGLGFNARPGTVDVYVLPAIQTADWSEAQVADNKERVRDLFVRTHQEMQWAS